ncbi:MAG: AAA family ATPase [Acidimicrobiales bacterium]|nr:AAA family ATPase [Acidimicrobiales bacterium]
MTEHPELAAEQAYVDHAYECLDAARVRARSLRSMVEVGKGGTEQARWEREMIEGSIATRLTQLDLGEHSLVFGRLDTDADHGSDTYYIGRMSVADDAQEPVVVDWRAPIAEAFYRATGPQPMGLARRRHFTSRGRTLLNLEDELFGDAVHGEGGGITLAADDRIQGHGALLQALETSRAGKLGDIVGTIQAEQDEIIRSPLPGVLVVQGGPGTGKTVVALHRAAYLLYTHRFPLDGQGVLVIGPNRLFLGYIDQVLPSLGEAGVELAVLDDLVDRETIRGIDRAAVARVKGDGRMAKVIRKAVADRQRGLREDLRVGFGAQTLVLTVAESGRIVREAHRRYRNHNPARRYVEQEFFDALAASARNPVNAHDVRDQLRSSLPVVEALEWMWPVLTPGQLLHDLFGSRALIELAARKWLRPEEHELLHRPRTPLGESVMFTRNDVPLLDEAHERLGPRKRRKGVDESIRTYGHIVVDEIQDLSPMQLRMVSRRSLNGSLTIVGDIAQATGAWAHESWDDILEHLPSRRGVRSAELTVGYRIPSRNMELAARVLRVAAPQLTPPRSVREGGSAPVIERSSLGGLSARVAEVTVAERDAVDPGSLAVIVPSTMLESVSEALDAAGVSHGRATRQGLNEPVTVVPVSMVKGLELDASVVVEPAAIIDEEAQGLRALYVALTRSTKRLAIVHERPLPDFFAEPVRLDQLALDVDRAV